MNRCTRLPSGLDTWDKQQYQRFRTERAAPFYDLLGLIEPAERSRVLDLGCGTGELTALAHERLQAADTLGIDASSNMLGSAPAGVHPDLRFELCRIEDFVPSASYDVVLSNAALHWVEDHPALFERLLGWLVPGGQLAIQMPSNERHPAHALARRLAAEEPFSAWLTQPPRRSPLLAPAEYALLLQRLGVRKQRVRLEVYAHRLDRTSDVVEWLKGSLFTHYAAKLGERRYAEFLSAYRERLFHELGKSAEEPYVLTYDRVFLWARRG